MAIGNLIVVASNSRGVRKEGILSGTVLPGQCVTQKKGVAADGMGHQTWEPYNRTADGDRALIAVVDVDIKINHTQEVPYLNGEQIPLYFPVAGEEINVRVAVPGTGTGNAVAIGDEFMLDDGTGMCIPKSGTPDSVPFESVEHVDDVTATGTLVCCMFTGY